MATERLRGMRVAALFTDGVEQIEFTEPARILRAAGAEVMVVSPRDDKVLAWDHTDWGQQIAVDQPLAGANPADFDALLLPGGVMNPDKLRTIPEAVVFVSRMVADGKPVAAICHGPWLLVEAEVVRGRTLTSWPSLKTDIRNAGGTWVDQEVAYDNGIITSRKPDDIPAFSQRMLDVFAQGQIARAETTSTAKLAEEMPVGSSADIPDDEAIDRASAESFPASDPPSFTAALRVELHDTRGYQ